MSERLQKFLSRSGIASRRKAEEYISAGRITVNGKVITTLGTKVDPSRDAICCDGKRVAIQAPKIFLFHKPAGVVTTLSDPQGRKTISHFTSRMPVRVYPVGRLDINVSGLLILTNDGDFAHELLHPRFGAEREYLAIVSGDVSKDTISRLKGGVRLEDGPARAKKVKKLSAADILTERYLRSIGDDESIVNIVVSEGRHHFVKRLLKEVGHPVRQLIRIRFGPHELGTLKPGEIRELKEASGSSEANGPGDRKRRTVAGDSRGGELERPRGSSSQKPVRRSPSGR